MVGGSTVAVVAALLACAASGARAATDTVSFSTGEHAIVVPAGVTSLHAVAVGGQGGAVAGGLPGAPPLAGGFGAVVTGDIAVTPGETLYLEVGGNGQVANPFAGTGSGGGGASDVRTQPFSAGLTPTDPRLLVAAGGGGSGTGDATEAGVGGSANAPGGDSTQINPQPGQGVSGGGGAGVPTGTGAGGMSGAPGASDFPPARRERPACSARVATARSSTSAP